MSQYTTGDILKIVASVGIPTFIATCLAGYAINNSSTTVEEARREEPLLTERLEGCALATQNHTDISGKTASELNNTFFQVTCDDRGIFGNATLRLQVYAPPGSRDGTQQVRVRGHGGLQTYTVNDDYRFDL